MRSRHPAESVWLNPFASIRVLRTHAPVKQNSYGSHSVIELDIYIVSGHIRGQGRPVYFEEFVQLGPVKYLSGFGKRFHQSLSSHSIYAKKFNASHTILNLLVDLNHQVDGLAVFINLSIWLWSHIHVALAPIGQREVLQTKSDFFDTEQFASLKWNETSQDLGRYYERIKAIRGLDSDVAHSVLPSGRGTDSHSSTDVCLFAP